MSQLIIVVRDNFGVFRARSDDRHFAVKHIPELWQFVNLECSQQSPQREDSRVAAGGDDAALSVRDVHGSELEHREWDTVATDSPRSIEHWSGTAEAHPEGSSDEQWRQYEEGHSRGRDVEEAFHGSVQKNELENLQIGADEPWATTVPSCRAE